MPYVKWVTKRRQILPMFRGQAASSASERTGGHG